MDGASDWYPDMFYGRFSVSSVDMLAQVVEKTIVAESGGTGDPGCIRRAAMLATDDPTAEAEALHDSIIATYLEPAGFTATRVYGAEGGETEDIAAAVNEGVLFTVYFGHSGTTGWEWPGFSQWDVNALTNDGKYGLAFGWSCLSANFVVGECFGETWLRAAHKGAAGYLSASSFVWWGTEEAWESSRRMERYFFQAFFEEGLWQVGPAWQSAGMRAFCRRRPARRWRSTISARWATRAGWSVSRSVRQMTCSVRSWRRLLRFSPRTSSSTTAGPW